PSRWYRCRARRPSRVGNRGRAGDLVLGKEMNPGRHTIAHDPTHEKTGTGSALRAPRCRATENALRYTYGKQPPADPVRSSERLAPRRGPVLLRRPPVAGRGVAASTPPVAP